MKGLIKTTGFCAWRVIYLKDNGVEDKINILNELGYIVKCENNAYVLYFAEDNSIVDIESESFKSIDDIFLYMDKKGWFEDMKVAVHDIDGEVIDVSDIMLSSETIMREDYDADCDEEQYIDLYDVSNMSDMEKIALISQVEFAVVKQCNGVYRFADYTGANLNGIEYERFTDIDSMLDRLQIYWNDYCIDFK